MQALEVVRNTNWGKRGQDGRSCHGSLGVLRAPPAYLPRDIRTRQLGVRSPDADRASCIFSPEDSWRISLKSFGIWQSCSCSKNRYTHSPLKTNCRLIIANRASEPIAYGNLTGCHSSETASQQTQKQTHALPRRFVFTRIRRGRCSREYYKKAPTRSATHSSFASATPTETLV
jgi:hypothetical protein